MLDDGVRTTSSIDQTELERRVTALYAKDYSLGERLPAPSLPLAAAASAGTCSVIMQVPFSCFAGGFDPDDEGLILDRKAHANYLSGGLGSLPAGERVAVRPSCCPPSRMVSTAALARPFRHTPPLPSAQDSSLWMPPALGSATGSRTGAAAASRQRGRVLRHGLSEPTSALAALFQPPAERSRLCCDSLPAFAAGLPCWERRCLHRPAATASSPSWHRARCACCPKPAAGALQAATLTTAAGTQPCML